MEYRGPARRSAQSSWSAPPFRSWVLKIFSLSSNRKENVAYLPLPPTDKESVYLAASVPQEEDQSFSVFSSQPSPDSPDDMGAFSRFISLIEVDHPKGLTHSELFLSVRQRYDIIMGFASLLDDLHLERRSPTSPARETGLESMEFCYFVRIASLHLSWAKT